MERTTELSHGGLTGFTAPLGVSITHVPDGETMLSLLERGELDAVMPSPYRMNSRLNKTELSDLSRSPRTRLLFDDPVAEAVRFFRARGFSHINHTVVVQDRVLEDHPAVAVELFRAFQEAKEIGYSRIDDLLRSSLLGAFGVLEIHRRTFGDDPFPYGLSPNRAALETLADYSFEQGLTSKRADVDERDPAAVETAITVNALFPHRLAAEAVRRGQRVIQIATDGVYAGASGPYDEAAPHDPHDVYGKTAPGVEVLSYA